MAVGLTREDVRQSWDRLLQSWEWEWFCSLTFKDKVSLHRADVLFRRWFRQLNRRNGLKVGYFKAVEWGKLRCVPHFHLLILGVGNSRRLSWMDRWHWGYARIYRFDRNRGAAYYLTKYCTKELADFELGGSLVKI